MITFCNPPLASATTSCESMGAECSLAQLGSAAMLIGFPFGTVPSSFTTPRTLADADPVLKEAGLTGPAARPPVRANNRIRPGTKILVFILHLTKFITSVMKLDQPGCARAYCMSGSAQNIFGLAGLV